MYFRVSDTDLGDNFTMTLSGDSSLFAISDVQYEQGTYNFYFQHTKSYRDSPNQKMTGRTNGNEM